MKTVSKLLIMAILIVSGQVLAQKQSKTMNVKKLKAGKNSVTYVSSGDKIAANLFLPPNYEAGNIYPTIILNPPASGVKEQTIGIYAEGLSKKGYITLAFDPRGFGESEGIVGLQDAYRIADDIKAGISYLSTLPIVDKDHLNVMGVCAGTGYAAYATAFDSRVKKFIGVSPFLTSSLDFYNLVGGATNLRKMVIPSGAVATQKFYETGENTFTKVVPTTNEEIAKARPIALGMMEYYLPGKPGDTPTWKNELSLLSVTSTLGFSAFDFIKFFDDVPTLIVYGSEAITRDGAQRFYNEVQGKKELLVVDGSGHFELYWKPEYVNQAVDKIDAFLKE